MREETVVMINNLQSAYTIFVRMKSILEECLQKAFEIAEIQNGNVDADFSSLSLLELLKKFLDDNEFFNRVLTANSADLVDARVKFLEVVNELQKEKDQTEIDRNGEEWLKGCEKMLVACEVFPNVESLGETFLKQARKLFYGFNSNKLAPVYYVEEIIEKENLEIGTDAAVNFLISEKISVFTFDKRPCVTVNYQEFLPKLKDYIAEIKQKNEKAVQRLKFQKISAGVIAVVLVFLSAFASSKITRAVINKSNANDNPQQTSKNQGTSSVDDAFSFSSFTNDSSSVDSSKVTTSASSNVSDTSSQFKTPVKTTVDSNGRITQKAEYNFVYETSSSYAIYNSDIDKQEVVYISLNSINFSETKGHSYFTLTIRNKTPYRIRNIAFDFVIKTESGDVVFTYTEDKLKENNATINIESNSSKYLCIDIDENNIKNKNAELGQVILSAKFSYDIMS